jgi:Predicted membrane protein, putative toxin regulator
MENENLTAEVSSSEETPTGGKSFTAVAKRLAKRYFIDAFSGMAQGLFVTLIAGTILKQIGTLFGRNSGFGLVLILIGNFACTLMGAGIGVGIAKKLKAPDLVLFACAAAGFIGAFLPEVAFKLLSGTEKFTLITVAEKMTSITLGRPGNPIGSYVATLFALEVVLLVQGKTKLDILIVPLCVLFMSFVTMFLAIPAMWLIAVIQKFIDVSTAAQPFIMGVVISVVMGILLTMPTSSAAIWIAIATGVTTDSMFLAGGAAVVGCAAQMVGFAVMSFKENHWGGLISQGIGTSMLQIPNIMRHPIIFVPPIIASAVVGPMATCLFKLRCNAAGGGMGTSGLVGVFGTLEASASIIPLWQTWLGIILLMFVLPALISWGVCEIFRKKGLIQEGWLKLEN